MNQPPPEDSTPNAPQDLHAKRWEQPVDVSRPGRLARILRMRSLVWETQLALLVWIIAAWFAYRTLTSHPPNTSPDQASKSSEQVDAAGF